MKARRLIAICLLLLTFPAVGCSDEDGGNDTAQAPTKLGEPERRLNLIAPPRYVEDGSTDADVDWVTPFERRTGCEVTVTLADRSAEAMRLIGTGNYDGVAATGGETRRLFERGLIAPLNFDLIPNYDDVHGALKNQRYDTFNGETYSVPQGRAANLLVYDPRDVSPPPQSWDAVFDRASDHRGAIAVPDDPLYIADAAVYLREHNPELGITDVYALDRKQFAAATELLRAQRRYVGHYYSDRAGEIRTFARDRSEVGAAAQATADILEAKGEPEEAVLPDEGATGWVSAWMLAEDARHPSCMYRWMNHILAPAPNAAAARWSGEAPSNDESCELVAYEDHCERYHAEDEDFFDRVDLSETPVRECGDDRADSCTPYPEWVAAWREIRGG